MGDYLYTSWMTDPSMLELAWEAVASARFELDGWSDAKARSVSRYLGKIARLTHSAKWAIKVERNAKFLRKLTEGERLAVFILHLVARGDAVSDVPEDVARLNQLHGDLRQIQAAQAVRIDLASDVAIAHKQRASQSKRARLPRGKLENGRNVNHLIADLARVHPEERPREIWPHLQSLLEELAGTCVEKTNGTQRVYEYAFGENRRKIGYEQFCHLLRQARKVKTPV